MKPSNFPSAPGDGGNAEDPRLGDLLRRHAAAGPVRIPDGFNAAVLGRIRAEMPGPPEALEADGALENAATPASEREAGGAWPLGRLVWSGLGGLAAAAAIFVALVSPALNRQGPPPEYYAQIYKATTTDPAISAVAVHSEQENVTVLWIEGLDYVPAQKN